MNTNYEKTITLDTEKLLEEYEYARGEYKKSIGDQQRDYWDGYLSAFERFLEEAGIDDW